MKKRFIWLLGGGIVLVFLIVVVVYFRRDNESSGFHAAGTVEGTEVNLASEIAGRILYVCCREGDLVQEGQVVVKLESDELQASVEQASARFEKAQADVEVSRSAIDSALANQSSSEAEIQNAAAEMERAKAQMDEAKRELDRYDALYKRQIVPKATLDVASTTHDTAVANYRSAQAKAASARSQKGSASAYLATARNQLKAAEAAQREAQANLAVFRAKLGQSVIKSPVTATVVYKALEKGETANPGVTILTIIDMANLFARIDVEETKVGNIALNQEVVIHADGLPGKAFHGKVMEIGRYGEFATQKDVTQARQDIKTFRVKVALPNTEGLLKPGMTVEVEVPRREGP